MDDLMNPDTDHDWRYLFKSLGFVPTEVGGLKGVIEGIEFTCVEHPWKGVAVFVFQRSADSVMSNEHYMPKRCSLDDFSEFIGLVLHSANPSKYPNPLLPTQEEIEAEQRKVEQQQAAAFERLPTLLRNLFAAVDELESAFGTYRRRFTPDGHLVGSIGEVVAAYSYNLQLLDCSSECHDAIATDGTPVQIKLTCGNGGIGLYSQPQRLLVLQFRRRKGFVEVFNGPGQIAWEAAGKMQKQGQRYISLFRLRKLQLLVREENQLPQVRTLPDRMAE